LLFAVDPERAHRLAIEALRTSARLPGARLSGVPVDLMGLRFPNRIGLAAGFDKSAQAVDGLGRLGFGFLEIGTVTLRPQSGQSRPRIFRVHEANALINRMGFPNDGAAIIARASAATPLPWSRRSQYRQERRYATRQSDRRLHWVSAYIARGRRLYCGQHFLSEYARTSRFACAGATEAIVERASNRARQAGRRNYSASSHRLEGSPDLDSESLEAVARVVKEVSADAIIATNTTVRRDGLLQQTVREEGGLSGAPLHSASMQTIAALRRYMGPAFPIIGVGGVDSPDKAAAMRNAGADLVQIYTGLVFRGPALISRCLRVL
jgi:dihydroorotate dehydrogenase